MRTFVYHGVRPHKLTEKKIMPPQASICFSVHYQPRFSANGDSKPVKVEALLRSNTNMPTDRLVSTLESNGLIGEVTLLVIKTVCSDIIRLQNDIGFSPGVSINVSPLLLNDIKFFLKARQILDAHKVPPEMIEFEITETRKIQNIKAVSTHVRSLRKDGYGVAIDDFGVGHSSFLYLDTLHASSLKIDKYFISKLGKENTCEVIVSSVARIASGLGIEAVAEGIETTDQMNFAVASGYSELQGFLLAKPMQITDLADFLRPRSGAISEAQHRNQPPAG